MQSLEFRAMNTSVLLAAEGGSQALAGLQAARSFIQECEQRFSRFIDSSELCRLNRSAGSWLPVSSDLMEMLRFSQFFHQETGGLFDPSILPDLERLGYDRSFDELKKDGAVGHVSNVTAKYGIVAHASGVTRKDGCLLRTPFAQLELDLNENRAYLPEGMQIDLGGLAKGWIVERAAQLLSSYVGVCAVNAGGDMQFIGLPSDGSDWQVYLEDPRDPSLFLTLLYTGPGAVATSSVVKRSWKQAGETRHHLIDPRTGQPADTGWLSVTVMAPQATVAEVFAKALLIGGESQAAHLFSRRIDLAYLAVDAQGRLVGSSNSKEYLHAHHYASS